jgi:hypothetical protein
VPYWAVHIIHCNGGSFKDDDDDDDDNKENILKFPRALEFSKPSTLALYHKASKNNLSQDL